MESEANLAELVGRMRLLETDHMPDDWPAVKMEDITALCNAIVTANTRAKELEAQNQGLADVAEEHVNAAHRYRDRVEEMEGGLAVAQARVKALEMQAPGYAELERERIITILLSDKAQVWLPEAGDLYPATANDLRKLF